PHARLAADGIAIEPYADVGVSLLHAAVDRADAGMRLEHDGHVLEPSVEYFLPTFDGDSIFNAFSLEPTADARLGYRHDGAFRVTADAWLRRYLESRDFAGGGDAGVERVISPRLRVRGDALWDDGFGGRRVGGDGEAAWR